MYIVLLVFILIVSLVVWYLLKNDKGAKEPIAALWIAAFFGCLAIPMAIGISFLNKNTEIILNGMYNPGLVFSYSMFIGLTEETVKFLPLAFFIYKKPYFNERTDGIIYFTIAGLAFGLIENILYTLNYGAGTGMLRVILVPFFHGATTGILGYFLAKSKVEKSGLLGVAFILAAMSFLHGFYNFGLFSQISFFVVTSLMTTFIIGIGLFLFYMKANELDKASGLSAYGKNNFCRACGRKNINHTLYCEYCGKRT